MFSPFFKHLLWRNSLKLKGTHLFWLGSAQHEGAAVTWTASTCVCFPFSFSPLGHQSKMESIRLYSSLVGNYSPKSRCQSSSPIFFSHFPAPAPSPGPNLSSVFFSSWFPASRCPSNLGWYKWEECSRGGEQGPFPGAGVPGLGWGCSQGSWALPLPSRVSPGSGRDWSLCAQPPCPRFRLWSRAGAAHTPVSRAGASAGGRKCFRPAAPLGLHTPTVRQGQESVPVCGAANIYLYCR